MLVTITEYDRIGTDVNGNMLPLGGRRIASNGYTADGDASALHAETVLIRVATDTGIQINFSGGAGSTSVEHEFIPANTVEFFAVSGATVLDILTAS